MQVFQPGDVPVPGYKLTAFLGKGSYGEVWRANGPGGVECALKFINLDSKAGLKEFRAIGRVKRLKHPNLVPIFAIWLRDAHGNTLGDNDAGESLSLSLGADKQLVLAMGLGEKSLLDLLAEARVRQPADALPGGLGLRRLLKYMQDAAAGIDYLNIRDADRGGNGAVEIIHCDIKPGNLLLVGGGVQVCDYGVAKALERSPGQDARTTMAAGTAAYAAPELINNEPGEWTDQYCLAITYYELRTGTLPFPEHRALQAHLLGSLDFARLPAAEQEVLKQATAMQPDRRFPTCAEFIEALYTQTGTTMHGGSVAHKFPADRSTGLSGTETLPPPGPRTSDLPPPAPPAPPRKLSDVLVQNGELVPDHTLVRQIGQGGYGQVWEARDKYDEPCALKLVRDLQGKGRHELDVLRQMRKLDHPHLLKITDWWVLGPDLLPVKGAGSTSGSGGVVAQAVVIRTPLADTNLRKRLDECRQAGQPGVPPDELVRYTVAAADAIDHLNRACDLVHRDIKPENLLLKDGEVLVSDFGLAKLVDRDGTAAQSTSSGMTQDYAAPEILTDKKVTTRSDQYSLAVTYHVLRTGRLPFPAGLSMLDLIRARASSRLDLTALTPDEQAALRPALSANPADRYPTCRALADALTRALEPVAELVPAPTPAPARSETPPPSEPEPEPVPERPTDAMATIGPGELAVAPGRKTDRLSVRDTPREDRPAAVTRTPGPRYVRPAPPPKRGRGKKVAAVVGVLASVAAVTVGAVLLFGGGGSGTPTTKRDDRDDGLVIREQIDRLADAARAHAANFEKPEAEAKVQEVAALAPDRADAVRQEVGKILDGIQALASAAQTGLEQRKFDDARQAADRLPAKHPEKARLLGAINTGHVVWLETEAKEHHKAGRPDDAKAAIARLAVLDAERAGRLGNELFPTPIPTPAAERIATARKGVGDLPAAARAAKLTELATGPDAEVARWAKAMTDARSAADRQIAQLKAATTAPKLIEAAQFDPSAVTKGLTAADAEPLRTELKAALTAQVEAVVPTLGGADTKGAEWAALAKVCEAAEPTPTVQALRLECWAEAGSQGGPPVAPPAEGDRYAGYVAARSAKGGPQRETLDRLAGLVPTGDNRPAWLNEYRAGKTHDLLVAAATAEPVRGPVDGPAADPYPAATAATAVTWLTAALRAADRAGDRVPDDRRAVARYELVLAGRSAPRPPAAAVLAAADALAKPGELDRLRKPAADQARFWLARANLRPAAAVDSFGKLFDLARQAKPPLPAAALYAPAVRNLLDPKWVADHSPTPEAKTGLAAVCYLAGREVRRRGGGWDELPDTKGQVERTAAKLFATAARLDPNPEYAAWHGISAALGPDGPAGPVSDAPDAAGPAGRLLAGLVAKRVAEKKPDLPDQLDGLQNARKAFRAAIEQAKPDAGRRDELALAYKSAADTAILLANFASPRDKAERQKALAEAIEWADALLALDRDWPAAWDTKGCALEDQVWLFKDDPTRFAAAGGYAAADKAFTTALALKGGRTTALTHRGRNQVKWAEDQYQAAGGREVVDTAKLDAARRDLEQALRQLADRPQSDLQAECHYWLGKAAALEAAAARPADRPAHYTVAAAQFEKALTAAGLPDGDRTRYRRSTLFDWAKLSYDEGMAAAGDKARCAAMAKVIDELLTRPRAEEVLGPAVVGYHRANALTLRYFADPARDFAAWFRGLDDVTRAAVAAPGRPQDEWAKVDLLVRRANAGRLDKGRDIKLAEADARQAVAVAGANPLVSDVWRVQARTALGRALDETAVRAEDPKDKRRLWTEAGDEYRQVVQLVPDPKASWPAYLQLGLVRVLAANLIDKDKVADRATEYAQAVAALMAAEAGSGSPEAALGETADRNDRSDFRRDRQKLFTGEDGKSAIRSFLVTAIDASPNVPAADGWRLAQTGVDLLLGSPLTAEERAAATQVAKRIQANPPSPDLALLAEQVLPALSR
ncbi:MAG: protein kinase [Gemmataceae bacterium]